MWEKWINKYNKKLIELLKQRINKNPGEICLFGNGAGDDKLNLQLAKYIENDKLKDDAYTAEETVEDPFKKRDEEFMKFKYGVKNSRNMHPYVASGFQQDVNFYDKNSERKFIKDNFSIHKSTQNFRAKNILNSENSRDGRIQKFLQKNKFENEKIRTKKYHHKFRNSISTLEKKFKNSLDIQAAGSLKSNNSRSGIKIKNLLNHSNLHKNDKLSPQIRNKILQRQKEIKGSGNKQNSKEIHTGMTKNIIIPLNIPSKIKLE